MTLLWRARWKWAGIQCLGGRGNERNQNTGEEERVRGKRERNKLAKLAKLRRGEKERGGLRGRPGQRKMRELKVKDKENSRGMKDDRG